MEDFNCQHDWPFLTFLGCPKVLGQHAHAHAHAQSIKQIV